MVAITGNVPGALIGKDAFQEIDITGITLPMTKHNYLVRNADDLPRVFAEAFHIARTGRPGPVHIDITKDALQQETRAQHPTEAEASSTCPASGRTSTAIRASSGSPPPRSTRAKRPVILAGHGVLLAEAVGRAPRVRREDAASRSPHTLLGDRRDRRAPPAGLRLHGHARLEARQPGDPVGRPAHRDRACASTTGSPATSAPTRPYARIIHVDIDPAEIGKNVAVDVPIVGDAGRVLRALTADGRDAHPTDARPLPRRAGRAGAPSPRRAAGTARAPGATASCPPTS